MKHAITVDFGSTFTKIVVIDLEGEREILLSDRVASSVGNGCGNWFEPLFPAGRDSNRS